MQVVVWSTMDQTLIRRAGARVREPLNKYTLRERRTGRSKGRRYMQEIVWKWKPHHSSTIRITSSLQKSDHSSMQDTDPIFRLSLTYLNYNVCVSFHFTFLFYMPYRPTVYI